MIQPDNVPADVEEAIEYTLSNIVREAYGPALFLAHFKEYKSKAAIAREYGISYYCVHQIIHGVLVEMRHPPGSTYLKHLSDELEKKRIRELPKINGFSHVKELEKISIDDILPTGSLFNHLNTSDVIRLLILLKSHLITLLMLIITIRVYWKA